MPGHGATHGHVTQEGTIWASRSGSVRTRIAVMAPPVTVKAMTVTGCAPTVIRLLAPRPAPA
jgi:hypothetical protein